MAGSLIFLIVLVVVVVALARRMQPHATPAWRSSTEDTGGSVRRVFIYALAAAGLVAAANGLTWMLQALLEATRPELGLSRASTLAFGLALAVVGTPTWWGFWRWASQLTAREARERAFLARRLYLHGVALSATWVALVAASQSLAWLLGVSAGQPNALATLMVWGPIAWLHARIAQREDHALESDAETTGEDALTLAAWPRDLHHNLITVMALVFAAVGTGMLLNAWLAAAYIATFAPLASSSGSWWWSESVRASLAAIAVGVVAWACMNRRPHLPQRTPVRWIMLLPLATLPGAAALLSAIGVVIYQLLQAAWGVSNVSLFDRFLVLPGALATALVGALVWGFHAATLQHAGAKGNTNLARNLERWSWLQLTIVSLGAVATGLAFLLSTFLGLLSSDPSHTLRGTLWRDPLFVALAILAVGAPVWTLAWRAMQQLARSSPAERNRVERRILLYGAVGMASVVALFTLGFELYRLLEAVLEGDSARLAAWLFNGRAALAMALTAAMLGGYHALVLRSDLQVAEPPERRPLRVRGVVLAPAADANTVRAWARARGGFDVWLSDAPATGVKAEDLDAAIATMLDSRVEGDLVLLRCAATGVQAELFSAR